MNPYIQMIQRLTVAIILCPVFIEVLPVIGTPPKLTDIPKSRQIFPDCKITFQIEVNSAKECADKPYAAMLIHLFDGIQPTLDSSDLVAWERKWRRIVQPMEAVKSDIARPQKRKRPGTSEAKKLICCVTPSFEFTASEKIKMSKAGSSEKLPYHIEIPTRKEGHFSILAYSLARFSLEGPSKTGTKEQTWKDMSAKFKDDLWSIATGLPRSEATKLLATERWEGISHNLLGSDPDRAVKLEAFFLAINNKDYKRALQFAWMSGKDLAQALSLAANHADYNHLREAMKLICPGLEPIKMLKSGLPKTIEILAGNLPLEICFSRTFSKSDTKTPKFYIYLICHIPARVGFERHPCQRSWYDMTSASRWKGALEEMGEQLSSDARWKFVEQWAEGLIGIEHEERVSLKEQLVQVESIYSKDSKMPSPAPT